MIIDTLDNLGFYFGMSKELDSAISVLKHYNLSALEAGEYPDFTDWSTDSVLKGGSELIGYAPRNKLSGWEYDAEHDVAYSNDECNYLPLRLEEYDFAIFFPQDAHRKIKSSGTKGYHKVVFKVPVKKRSRWSF